MAKRLGGGTALYENPICALQFDHDLVPNGWVAHRLLFAPAFDDAEIARLKRTYLSEKGFTAARAAFSAYVAEGRGVLSVATPDSHLDAFVNTWLPRQVHYHGDTNRLSTDPQTRNLLQDAMGSAYIKPATTRAAVLKALSQQNADGSMPDGVTLYDGAELKYINQIPHTDHCVWLPICLEAYLDETDDYAVLDEVVDRITVRERLSNALRWLAGHVDHRGLNFIDQGDWNDPMNMVGWKGKGVSGWLSLATAHALRLWAGICEADGRDGAQWRAEAERFNTAHEHASVGWRLVRARHHRR
ncbi:MAG: hypothetical protein WDN06_18150 [Asticcacaulis sp.]